MTVDQAAFGSKLRGYRQAAALSQEALAEAALLSTAAIKQLESGRRARPRLETVHLLAEALRLSAAERATLLAAARPAAPPGPVFRAPRHNLPAQTTALIGRDSEVATALGLLQGHSVRLLTLTGVGGAGKTRLAVEIARALLDGLATSWRGVWLVELAPLTDPALVVPTVATTLGLRESPGIPLLSSLCDHLQTGRLLLVLDNCEHVVEACAALVGTLLRACPEVRILATSREGLSIPEEALQRVPSLAFPDPKHLPPSEELAAYPAVTLFLQRGQARRTEFVLSPDNARAVAEICARLDGIPLAIELAAARLSALPVEQVAARLDDCFRLLTGGSRTALPRQQTLRATLDWSHDLLSEPEQALLRRLAVFAGGWTLEAAEAVCAVAGGDDWAVLDLLGGLVQKSLVLLEVGASEGRYGFLETVRQYAREQLLAAGEVVLVQRRHATYYRELAERSEREFTGPDQLHWLDEWEREHDNLRAALAWCVDGSEHEEGDEATGAVETALRLSGGVFWFWLFRDHRAEPLAWLKQALARGAAVPAAVRAKALFSAGVLAGGVNDLVNHDAFIIQSVALSRQIGDTRQCVLALGAFGSSRGNSQEEQGAAALEESLALARAVGEPWLIAYALLHRIFKVANTAALDWSEERARAWAAGEEALQLFGAVGDRMTPAVMLLSLGQIALYGGDYGRARVAFVASLPLLRDLGWRSTLADGLVGLADVAREQGDYGEATTLYREGLQIYRDIGDRLLLPAIAAVLSRLAAIALEQEEWAVAQAHVTESLAIAQDIGPGGGSQLVRALEVRAALAAVQGASGRAVGLAGAAAALRARINRPAGASEQATLERRSSFLVASSWSPAAAADQAILERRLAPARQALSLEAQTTAWAEGLAMTPEQAITYALDGLAPAAG